MMLHHVQVACPRGGEDAARRFWADGVGMAEVDKPSSLAGRGGCWFRSGSAEVHVGVEEPFAPARKAHPALVVDDLEAVGARLAGLGFEVDWTERHTFPGFERCHVLDAHGNRVELLAGPARVAMHPVGVVRSTRAEVADDGWDRESARIVLDEAYGEEALYGLDAFSHVEVVYHFDRVPEERVESGARRPRNNPDWPLVGIFAQRGKNRPNRIGTTICRVLGVEGRTLSVAGLDAVDGTPVLDLKPWMAEFGPRGDVRQPSWSAELMAGYWD